MVGGELSAALGGEDLGDHGAERALGVKHVVDRPAAEAQPRRLKAIAGSLSLIHISLSFDCVKSTAVGAPVRLASRRAMFALSMASKTLRSFIGKMPQWNLRLQAGYFGR